MKKIILFSMIAVVAVTVAGFAQSHPTDTDVTIGTTDYPADCGGCGGGERVCCANTSQNHD